MTMSENSLRFKKALSDTASLQAHRSNNSPPDCTSFIPSKKRKNRNVPEKSRRKRKRREEDKDVSFEKQNKKISSVPETSQRKGNELYSDSKLRGPSSDDTTPLVAQRSHNSTQGPTCLVPGENRDDSSSVPETSRRKRNRSEEDEDVSSVRKSKQINNGPEDTESKGNERDNTVKGELEKKYSQLDCLGAGGNGSVYAGYRRDDNLPVAIKHIPIKNAVCTAVILDEVKKTFPLEVVLMLMASDVENEGSKSFSVALLDWYELQDELVLVMERPVPSMDLFHYTVDGGRPLNEDEAKVILRQLVEGMIHIHSNGVLHRDIKPDNILIQTTAEGPSLHILDFGCGCTAQEGPYTQFCGTHTYAPPEWYLQRSYQAVPCTVWQVGLVLYFMLCGTHAFRNSTEIVSKELYIPDNLSQECKDLLRRCLAKQPEERPSLNSILEHPWLTRA